MKPIDYVIIALAVAVVVGAIALTLWRKNTGINSCGCGCQGCSGCAEKGQCSAHKNAEEELHD